MVSDARKKRAPCPFAPLPPLRGADMLTKALDTETFAKHRRDVMNLACAPAGEDGTIVAKA